MLKSCRRACALAAITLFVVAGSGSANAITVKFYSGTADGGYTGAYSGAGTVYSITDTLATDLPSAASVDSTSNGDSFGTALKFKSDSVTATASGSPNTNGYQVWDDLQGNYAGLGVDNKDINSSGEDQISGGEILTLSFETSQKLLGIGTLFASGHTPFDGLDTPAAVQGVQEYINFEMRIDGGDWKDVLFSVANDVTAAGLTTLDYIGTVFDFRQETANVSCGVACTTANPSFYIGAIITENSGQAVVPLPAGILLMLSGLLGLGFLGRFKAKMA